METPQFVYTTYIATTPEKLWEALTNPGFTEQYWSESRVQSDWTVGSPVRHMRGDREPASLTARPDIGVATRAGCSVGLRVGRARMDDGDFA